MILCISTVGKTKCRNVSKDGPGLCQPPACTFPSVRWSFYLLFLCEFPSRHTLFPGPALSPPCSLPTVYLYVASEKGRPPGLSMKDGTASCTKISHLPHIKAGPGNTVGQGLQSRQNPQKQHHHHHFLLGVPQKHQAVQLEHVSRGPRLDSCSLPDCQFSLSEPL